MQEGPDLVLGLPITTCDAAQELRNVKLCLFRAIGGVQAWRHQGIGRPGVYQGEWRVER